MSYRTFKRVLGETNLERKCRWWFGLSLVVLLTISFTWYGRRTDKLVDDRIKTLSEELWRAGWQKLHIEKLAETEKLLSEIGEQANRGDQADLSSNLYARLAQSSEALGRDFEWHALLPPTADLKHGYRTEDYFPDEDERRLINDRGWFSGTTAAELAPRRARCPSRLAARTASMAGKCISTISRWSPALPVCRVTSCWERRRMTSLKKTTLWPSCA